MTVVRPWQTVVAADALAECLGEPDIRILDCRFRLDEPAAGRRAYLQAHLPGARYVDLDRDLAGPPGDDTGRHPLPERQRLAQALGALGIDAGSRVVVYDDQGGAIAARAWWLLRWLGHADTAILDGGLQAWQGAGLPLEGGPVECAPADFPMRPALTRCIGVDELGQRLQQDLKNRLVDARSEARFRGDEEPIDPVSGHIPGAVNLPFSECLDGYGCFKSPQELQAMWSKVVDTPASGPVAVMCGSGVTACHLVAAALLAGLREPMVYIGSWSEWIRDPGRPRAAGAAGQGRSLAEPP